MRIGREMQTTADPPRVMYLLLAMNHIVEMQETTNHCIVYDGGKVHGYWPLY